MDLSNSADLKRHMRVIRTKFGADTKIGRRASNVEEALLQYPDPSETGTTVEFKRGNIEKSIKRWLIELNGLLMAA